LKKIDLHIHTIATAKDADFTFDIDKMQLYVQISKLDAIAITNHNMFDKEQFNSIKEKLNITVFPGVEVDIENAHVIVIADESDLDIFAEQCNQLKEKMEDGRQFISYDEFINIFNNYEQYLLIPHYKKKPALQQQIIKKFGKNITCGEVDSIKKFCTLKKQEDDLAPILSSDVRIKKDLDVFPTRHTFLDIDDTTLKSVKYGLMDKTRVYITESKNDNEFIFTQDGLVASTKLNVIIGKRSSGKTHTLETIKKTFDNCDIKYIKQFEITEKSGSEKFEEITRKGYEKITNDYITPINELIPNILEIDLNADISELENYHSALISRAISCERNDVFSKTSLFNEITFDVKTNKELEELINAIKVLLDNETYREIIETNIKKKSLQALLAKLIIIYRNEQLDVNLKKEVDKLVKSIQKKLELKSSVDTIPQIDLYSIMKNRLIANRFNEDLKKIKEKSDIFKGDYQRFKIIATKSPYKNVSEMKDGANITTGSFKDTFDKFYRKDSFKYIKQLKEDGVALDKLGKTLVEIKYKVINQKGTEISGGEKAEFNLLKELDDAKNYDILLLDEPESSFDNPYIKENINTLIKDISNKTPVFVVTHNNTLGISNKADKIIYTMYNDKEHKYEVYVGNFTDTMLIDKDGKKIKTYDAIVSCMEAGVDAYEERSKIYENLKI
jgi:hypothetical protein